VRTAPPRRRSLDDRPPAPWGSFPLVELVVLVALVLLIGGLVVGGDRGPTMVIAGLAVGSLGGLELSIREHFAGYRSHTLLLSGAAGLAALALIAFAIPSLWLPLALGAGLLVFGACAVGLSRAFRRRAGVSFRVR
jgi:hypothetical protein